jgi:hypothetical protein
VLEKLTPKREILDEVVSGVQEALLAAALDRLPPFDSAHPF